MKILVVPTSCGKLGNTNDSTGVWLEELATPYFIFRDAGAEVTLASPQGGRTPLDPKSERPEGQTAATERFRKDRQAQACMTAALKLGEISVCGFDAVFYPGGHGLLWDLVEDEDSITLIETMFSAGKPVAAVCHGPGVFRRTRLPDGAPLVRGKSVTGFSNSEEDIAGLTDLVPFLIEDELRRLGGEYSKADDWQEHTVVDGNLVTGQNPASSRAVADAVLKQLTRGS